VPVQGFPIWLLASSISPVTTELSWVGATLQQTVPWVRTVGVEFDEVGPGRAVVRLPDAPGLRNHVGGPHAAMIFGLGETASGAVTLAAFASAMERATPLPVRSEIVYQRIARGPLTAVAVLSRSAADVLAELAAGTRPEFGIDVTVTDGEGGETTRMTVVWTLAGRRGPGESGRAVAAACW
jgi:acyl-coenzyme A thioesterase PaaI-like protein